MTVVMKIYKSRDNANALQLKANGKIANLIEVTAMELRNTDMVFSSDNGKYFDWSEGNGVVYIRLGRVGSLDQNSSYRFNLIVYDPGNPHGIDWGIVKIKVA